MVPPSRRRLRALTRHVRRLPASRVTTAAPLTEVSVSTIFVSPCGAALQSQLPLSPPPPPVAEMSEREKFLLDMNGNYTEHILVCALSFFACWLNLNVCFTVP